MTRRACLNLNPAVRPRRSRQTAMFSPPRGHCRRPRMTAMNRRFQVHSYFIANLRMVMDVEVAPRGHTESCLRRQFPPVARYDRQKRRGRACVGRLKRSTRNGRVCLRFLTRCPRSVNAAAYTEGPRYLIGDAAHPSFLGVLLGNSR